MVVKRSAKEKPPSGSINLFRKKNAEEYKAVIDDYLEAGEFRTLNYYLEMNVISASMPAYEDYKAVFNAISNYSFFYADIIGYMHPSGEKNLATYPTRLEGYAVFYYPTFLPQKPPPHRSISQKTASKNVNC